MPAKRALFLALFLLLFLLPLTIAVSKRPTQTTSRGATEPPRSSSQKTSEPPYAKNQVIVKFREAQSILEANKIQTFSQMEKDNLPTAMVKLNQLQPIQSVEKIFKKIEPPSSLDQKVPPAEPANPEANKVFLITFTKEIEPAFIIKGLTDNPEVEYAEPNYIYQTCLTPNDPYFLDSYPNNVGNRDPNWNPAYDYQWNLKKIQLDKAWDLEKEGEPVLVAVIDTGVDYTHPDFGECTLEQVNSNSCKKITPGWNFINNTNDPKDDNLHGTHVAGVIAAITNNNLGVASFDKNGIIRVIPLKALDQEGGAPVSILAAAIDYATQKGTKAINMSWGGEGTSQTIEDAINNGLSKGVIFVAAAGNDTTDVSSFFPAAIEGVIAVSATDEKDNIATYSNFGTKISVSAPGGSEEKNLLSLAPVNLIDILPPDLKEYIAPLIINHNYLRISGTSMATPHVTALAALILNQNPQLTNQQVRSIILNSADDLGAPNFDNYFGYGRINVYKALTEMDSSEPPTVRITYPPEDFPVGKNFQVYGVAKGEGFENFSLMYSLSPKCEEENEGYSSLGVTLHNPNQAVTSEGLLAEINLPESILNDQAKVACLKLILKAKGQETYTIGSFFVDKMIAPNWPIKFGLMINFPRTQQLVADINNDQLKEIAFINWRDGQLYVFDKNARISQGFPTPTRNIYYPPYTPASVEQKIFIPIQPPLIFPNELYAGRRILGWNGADGSPLTNWRLQDWPLQDLLAHPVDNIVLEDVDLDGRKDIIYGEYDHFGSKKSKVYVFDQERRPLPGWEGGVDLPLPEGTLNSILLTAPLVGNVEGEPSSPPEIVVVVYDWEQAGCLYTADPVCIKTIVVYDSKGKLIANFRTSLEMRPIVQAALGDINGDGLAEIITASSDYYDEPSQKFYRNGRITVWNGKGAKIWEYKFPGEAAADLYQYPPLVLADFDNDTYPEIFTCSDTVMCVALDGDGKPLKGFPYSPLGELFSKYSPYTSIVKLKNNHLAIIQDTLISKKAGITVAEYNPENGQMSTPPGFPKYHNPLFKESLAFNIIVGFPISTDIEGDGKLDIVVPVFRDYKDYTYVYNTGLELAPKGIEWSQYRNNESRTGSYATPEILPPCRTCENFTGCLVGKTCMQQCQINPDQCESKPCEAGAACTCRSGAPEEYRCPN